MQDHRFDFTVDGTPEEVWDALWAYTRRDIKTPTVTIEIYNPGDDAGNGLVRHCTFPVPKYLLFGGVAQSWEWITEPQRPLSWRYDAIGKPLWSNATGWTRLEEVDPGRTRVFFRETYEARNPVMRMLLEKRVHDFISKDNDQLIEASLLKTLERRRARRSSAG